MFGKVRFGFFSDFGSMGFRYGGEQFFQNHFVRALLGYEHG
jgi:hypothetical protein